MVAASCSQWLVSSGIRWMGRSSKVDGRDGGTRRGGDGDDSATGTATSATGTGAAGFFVAQPTAVGAAVAGVIGLLAL